MVSFINKKIKSQETLGERLRKVREGRGLSLEKVSAITRIQKKYLFALEKGRYSELIEEIYTKNFIRAYSRLLGLNSDFLLNLYQKEFNLYSQAIDKTKNNNLINPLPFHRLTVAPYLARNIVIGLVTVLFLFFLGFKVKKITAPPLILLERPVDNLVIQDPFIEVAGKTEKEISVFINGQEALSDKNGYFQENISLQKGLNIIKILAAKKYSKEKVVYRQIMVEENKITSLFNNN